jgi:hypothetical protein
VLFLLACSEYDLKEKNKDPEFVGRFRGQRVRGGQQRAVLE